MRLANSAIALAVAIGIIVLPAIGVPVRAAVGTEPATVGVEFTPSNTGILVPGQPLVLNGTITNRTATDVPAGTAVVYLNRTPVGTRAALAEWLAPGSASASERLGTAVLEAATPIVPAGRQAPIQLVVPASAIDFGTQSIVWGARTLAVRITAAGEQIGQSRSSIVWNTNDGMGKTGLALIVPLTVPPDSAGLISADDLAGYTAQGGLLSRQLDEVINQDVALGIDPRILASIRILGTSTPPSALAWLERLRAADNVTFALTYADYDLAAASQSNAPGVLAPTSFPINESLFPEGVTPTPTSTPSPSQAPGDPTTVPILPPSSPSPVPSPSGPPMVTPGIPDLQSLLAWSYTLSAIAWPADDSVIESDLDAFSAGGLTTTIMSSNNVGYGDLAYTPSSPARVGSHSVLVSDATISALFRSASRAIDPAEWEVAMTQLSSTLAVVAREQPSQTRTLLATLGRSLPGSNDRVSQTLAALFSLPWVSATPVTNLVASFGGTPQVSVPGVPTTPPAVSVGSPVSAAVAARALPESRLSAVTALLASEAVTASFATVLATPALITGERRLSLLATLANGWPDDQSRVTEEKNFLTASDAIRGSVSIAKSSSVHIIATSSLLPVTVTNRLPWPVTVNVFVRSPNSLLTISKEQVSLTIQAASQAKVTVPVRANANGDSRVSVRLTSPTDVPIAGPEFTDVDVQAGWETAFTAIVAAFLLAIFGFGIYRNVTKRRRAGSATEAAPYTGEKRDSADSITS